MASVREVGRERETCLRGQNRQYSQFFGKIGSKMRNLGALCEAAEARYRVSFELFVFLVSCEAKGSKKLPKNLISGIFRG